MVYGCRRWSRKKLTCRHYFSVGEEAGPAYDLPVDTGSVWCRRWFSVSFTCRRWCSMAVDTSAAYDLLVDAGAVYL